MIVDLDDKKFIVFHSFSIEIFQRSEEVLKKKYKEYIILADNSRNEIHICKEIVNAKFEDIVEEKTSTAIIKYEKQ